MRFSTVWHLSCDEPSKHYTPEGCHGQSDGGLSRQECIDEAIDAGWLVKSRTAYCPECRKAHDLRTVERVFAGVVSKET